jgi:hypothetical protein
MLLRNQILRLNFDLASGALAQYATENFGSGMTIGLRDQVSLSKKHPTCPLTAPSAAILKKPTQPMT